jgi:K+-transporting ATPase ATPase A chain
MEGKETRFGIGLSSLFADDHHGRFQRLGERHARLLLAAGRLVPLVMMQLGEVVFGGVGTGCTACWCSRSSRCSCAGLMIGRTPEYLGKKIEAV